MNTRKIILFFVLSFSAVFLNAQDVKIGIIGGLNFSSADLSIDGEEVMEKEYPRISAFGELKVYKSLWITASAGYLGTGYTFTDFNECYVNMNYFQLELALKYKYGNFYGFIGPTCGFFLNGEKNQVSGIFLVDDEYVYGYKKEAIASDIIKSPNFGANLGIGLDIQLKKKIDLFLQVEYALGFTDVLKESETELKLRGLSVQTGIKFGF